MAAWQKEIKGILMELVVSVGYLGVFFLIACIMVR